MALDGLVIHSLVDELKEKLVGGKIDKVYQPEDDEILLTIRNNKENHKLLVSASASNTRTYLTKDYKKENPINAPMFCMILRKYIQGGKITEIKQLDFERVIHISVESLDELKTKSIKTLIIEIMGRHSNIILIHENENKIIDSIKRIPPSVSRVRQILPGQAYINPPSQNKQNPIDNIDFENFKSILKNSDNEIFKSIYQSFVGISPIVSKEICYRSNLEQSKIANTLDIDELKKQNKFLSIKYLYNAKNEN